MLELTRVARRFVVSIGHDDVVSSVCFDFVAVDERVQYDGELARRRGGPSAHVLQDLRGFVRTGSMAVMRKGRKR